MAASRPPIAARHVQGALPASCEYNTPSGPMGSHLCRALPVIATMGLLSSSGCDAQAPRTAWTWTRASRAALARARAGVDGFSLRACCHMQPASELPGAAMRPKPAHGLLNRGVVKRCENALSLPECPS